MLFEPLDVARPDLLGETIDDFDAGQIPLVDRAIERLPGKRLLMNRAVGIAIEQAAKLVLELAHTLERGRYQRPRQVLIGEPRAAFDRVHEMALDRVLGRQSNVVAPLNHASAAALSEQAL